MKKRKFSTKGMTRQQVEKLSKKNARKIINGTDKLQSWGTTGWFKSQRLNRYFKFRSMIEANVIRTLDEANDYIVDFDMEQFMIPYDYKGAKLNYVPDVILRTCNDNVFVVEVKPANQLSEDKNVAKWSRAKVWCWNRGVRFLVITDKDWPELIKILQLIEDKNIQEAQSLMKWNMLLGN